MEHGMQARQPSAATEQHKDELPSIVEWNLDEEAEEARAEALSNCSCGSCCA